MVDTLPTVHHEYFKRKKRGEFPSVKAHSREERNGRTLKVDEPLKVLLKDTFITTMHGKNSIQARLGSVGLPSTVKQFDPSFTNPSDQVTVQKHIRNVGARDNLGVILFPITTLSDRLIHETFDLTHDQQFASTKVVWIRSGTIARGVVPLPQLSHRRPFRISTRTAGSIRLTLSCVAKILNLLHSNTNSL